MAGLGFLSKLGKFFRQMKIELKKVNWPSREDLSSNTLVVIVTIVVLIGFIGIVDFILAKSITPFIIH
jgi:preprotein translocase subunit SecE